MSVTDEEVEAAAKIMAGVTWELLRGEGKSLWLRDARKVLEAAARVRALAEATTEGT